MDWNEEWAEQHQWEKIIEYMLSIPYYYAEDAASKAYEIFSTLEEGVQLYTKPDRDSDWEWTADFAKQQKAIDFIRGEYLQYDLMSAGRDEVGLINHKNGLFTLYVGYHTKIEYRIENFRDNPEEKP